MKINKILLFIPLCLSLAQAEDLTKQTREIIGSGLFHVNETRTYTVGYDSTIAYDGSIIGDHLFEIIGSGFRSAIFLKGEVDSNLEEGLVKNVSLFTNLRGPVTSLTPLEILEQPILITSDTVNVAHSSINIGDSLAISGYLNGNNSHKATRLMANDRPDQWKVRGFVSNLDDSFFNIGKLAIIRNNEEIKNCTQGINNGSRVEVLFDADDNYVATGPIKSIVSIECLKFNDVPMGVNHIPSVVQGFVTGQSGQDFWIDDVLVRTTVDTVYENGTKRFINNTVNVEVQGIIDAENSIIDAEMIRFIEPRIEVTFPVMPSDVNFDKSVVVNGVTFNKTPQSEDISEILSGLNVSRQVQILGYVDGDDNAYISQIKDIGDTNFDGISLRGKISSINQPYFTVLNFTIDTRDSPLFGPGSGLVGIDEFFDMIKVGSQVELQGARLDSNSGKLTHSSIKIEQIDDRQSPLHGREIIGSGIIRGFTTATISSFKTDILPIDDLLFECYFEQE